MLKSQDVTVAEKFERTVRIVLGFIPSRKYDPVVVVVLVVIARHLLLSRTNRERLNVRVEQATAPAHIFQCEFGTIYVISDARHSHHEYDQTTEHNVTRTKRVLEEIIADQMCLKERTHL